MRDKKLVALLEAEIATITIQRDILSEVKKIYQIHSEILQTKSAQKAGISARAIPETRSSKKPLFGRLATIACAVLVLALGVYFLINQNNNGTVSLAAPANIQIEGDKLTWDPVLNATGYIVEIDGMTYETFTASFTIPSTTAEICKIKIKAKGSGTNAESVWAYEPEYNVQRYQLTVIADVGAIPAVSYYADGATVTLNAISKIGYTFEGWYDKGTGLKVSGAFVYTFKMSANSFTLEARFNPQTYTITYMDEGGAFSGIFGFEYPASHIYGTTTALVNPTKEGYDFAGWFLNNDGSGSAITSLDAAGYTADIALYAKWTEALFKYTPINSDAEYEISVANGSVLFGIVTIPDFYNGLPVTAIADFGFCDNNLKNDYARTNAVTSFVIPNKVMSIGNSAFLSCTSLESLVFSGDSLLTTIGDCAFIYCAFTSITIPANVTSIGTQAFYGCALLENVIFESKSKLSTIGDYAFCECALLTSITIPASVISIGTRAFDNCTSLLGITFESKSKLSTIGNYAFADCASLKSVTIPANVISIGIYVFENCTSLIAVIYESKSMLTTIGNYAFSQNISLTSIIIPASVINVGNYAFFGCSSLTIYCEAQSKPGGWNINWNPLNRPVYWGINNTNFIEVDGAQYVIESGDAVLARYMGDDIFFSVPLKVTVNGTAYNVTSIGSEAFRNCIALTSLTIPINVTSIGDSAFCGWTALQTIYIKGYESEVEVDEAFLGSGWRSDCAAQIIYGEND